MSERRRPRYWLAKHVYLHASRHGAVFLDVAQDAYLGISATQSGALALLVAEWPEHDAVSTVSEAEAQALADALHTRGLLTRDRLEGHGAAPCAFARATRQLVAWQNMTLRDVKLRYALRFIRAAVMAAVLLRVRTFEQLVTRHERRKAAALESGGRRAEAGIDAPSSARGAAERSSAQSSARRERELSALMARQLLASVAYVRPWLYGFRGHCLFDSLALIELLAGYGVFPHWVFGVQLRPFVAHTWVQQGRYVLNGTPEHVSAFEPILVV